jgi:hypothetical protein
MMIVLTCESEVLGVETSNLLTMKPLRADPSKPGTTLKFTNGHLIVVQESLNNVFKKMNIRRLDAANEI